MENYIQGGGLVLIENATAASNIVAGTMVAVGSASNAVYSYARDTTGLSDTGGSFGIRFIGVLDDDVSAGQTHFSIRTQGVFEFTMATGQTATRVALNGRPVFAANTGLGLQVITDTGGSNVSGTHPIGTVVGCAAGGSTTGQTVRVKINPKGLVWGPYAEAATTGHGNEFPPTL